MIKMVQISHGIIIEVGPNLSCTFSSLSHVGWAPSHRMLLAPGCSTVGLFGHTGEDMCSHQIF